MLINLEQCLLPYGILFNYLDQILIHPDSKQDYKVLPKQEK